MKAEETGKMVIGRIRSEMIRDSFISTNFRIEHSGEWMEGKVNEYHERLVFVPEDHWIDSCGNGFAIEYLADGKGSPRIVFGVRSPYTAPRNLKFSEELADIMEKTFADHGMAHGTLQSSDSMDSRWRVWTEMGSMDSCDEGRIRDMTVRMVALMNEVFVAREKVIRPDYLIF